MWLCRGLVLLLTFLLFVVDLSVVLSLNFSLYVTDLSVVVCCRKTLFSQFYDKARHLHNEER